MNIEDVSKIIDKIDKSSISYFELDIESCHLKLDKSNTRNYLPVETSTHLNNEIKASNIEGKKAVSTETAVTLEKPVKEEVQDDENIIIVKSPIVGTFYDAPSPDSEKYVEVGSEINKGDIICIIESMKLMNEIEAEESGKVVEVIAKNGAMVQYGDPLFKVRRG